MSDARYVALTPNLRANSSFSCDASITIKFEYFKETGVFNKETASKFKINILSQGGTEEPMVLYKRFRGKEPQPEALLKRAGLL